jgi:hypothetical protein
MLLFYVSVCVLISFILTCMCVCACCFMFLCVIFVRLYVFLVCVCVVVRVGGCARARVCVLVYVHTIHIHTPTQARIHRYTQHIQGFSTFKSLSGGSQLLSVYFPFTEGKKPSSSTSIRTSAVQVRHIHTYIRTYIR